MNIIFILWQLGKRRQWLQPGTNTYRSSCLWRRHKDWFVFLVSSLYVKIYFRFLLLCFFCTSQKKYLFGIWGHHEYWVPAEILCSPWVFFVVSKNILSFFSIFGWYVNKLYMCNTLEASKRWNNFGMLLFFFSIPCLLYFVLDYFGNRRCTQSVTWSFFRCSSQDVYVAVEKEAEAIVLVQLLHIMSSGKVFH